jgi:hypothetical protein
MEVDANSEKDTSALFGSAPLDAFERGAAARLLLSRNRQLGALLVAERSVYYVQILYRMLLFKREHELEPLYEDIYHGVRQAQETLGGGEYLLQQFRQDMDQLRDWGLVTFRIEKERLRGYRDNRKKKFRYALSEECDQFIQWLELRLLSDLEDRGHDTRDLLQDVCGALNELLRLLHHLRKDGEDQAEEARRIVFQLVKTDELTRAITLSLIEFNGRLLHFLISRYDMQETRQVISELDSYVHSFLQRLYSLRREIVPLIDRLLQDNNRQKIELCFTAMERERLQTPHLFQVSLGPSRRTIGDHLHDFYIEDGKLDRLHQRIGASVIKVWQKLHSHLREMERKNNRLVDIGERIKDLAELPEETVPSVFLAELLAPAAMCGDMHFWDLLQKADPPEPRRVLPQNEAPARNYLRTKEASAKPVQTMDETRLEELRQWLTARMASEAGGTKISEVTVDSFTDFARIMELARAGFLNSGNRLARIDFQLTDLGGEVAVDAGEQSLTLRDILIENYRANP